MGNERPFGFIDFLLLLCVLAAATVLRGWYLITFADSGASVGPVLVQDAPPLVRDSKVDPDQPEKKSPLDPEKPRKNPQTELEALVATLKEHNLYQSRAPFSEEEEATAHYSPGYPWFLGMLARVIPDASFTKMVRLIQLILGALTAGLYFLFARRAFASRTVALLAGAFTVAYPFWVISTADFNDAVLASFLLALCVHLGTRGIQTHGPFTSLLYGLALAGLALVRAAALPFTFVALGWYLYRSRHETRGWLCALLAFLGFVNGLAPWTVRNFQVFGEPLPVVSSTWLHLWVGNNEHATGGPETEQMYASAPAGELRGIKDQPARYARLGDQVRDEVTRHPAETLHRRIRAGLAFLWGERFFTSRRLADPATPGDDVSAWELPLAGSLVVLYALFFLGWRWTYGWRKECVPATSAVIWLPLPYILSHAEVLHGPRLPLDGVLLCYATFALACLIPGIGGNLLEARQPGAEGEGS